MLNKSEQTQHGVKLSTVWLLNVFTSYCLMSNYEYQIIRAANVLFVYTHTHTH